MLRKPFRHVSIDKNENGLGRVLFFKLRPDRYYDERPERTRALVERDAMVAIAGPAAEAHFGRRKKWLLGARGDTLGIFDALDFVTSGPKEGVTLRVTQRGFFSSPQGAMPLSALARQKVSYGRKATVAGRKEISGFRRWAHS